MVLTNLTHAVQSYCIPGCPFCSLAVVRNVLNHAIAQDLHFALVFLAQEEKKQWTEFDI